MSRIHELVAAHATDEADEQLLLRVLGLVASREVRPRGGPRLLEVGRCRSRKHAILSAADLVGTGNGRETCKACRNERERARRAQPGEEAA